MEPLHLCMVSFGINVLPPFQGGRAAMTLSRHPERGVLAVKIMPDFGTVRENEAAFDVAVAYINSGDIDRGRSILVALRDHIWSTEEQKSTQWILPKVLETLKELNTCIPSTTSQIR